MRQDFSSWRYVKIVVAPFHNFLSVFENDDKHRQTSMENASGMSGVWRLSGSRQAL